MHLGSLKRDHGRLDPLFPGELVCWILLEQPAGDKIYVIAERSEATNLDDSSPILS